MGERRRDGREGDSATERLDLLVVAASFTSRSGHRPSARRIHGLTAWSCTMYPPPSHDDASAITDQT